MQYFTGIDTGSVNTKISVIDSDCRVVFKDSVKLERGPVSAVNSLLKRLSAHIPLESITGAAYSGPVNPALAAMGWVHYSSSLASATGVLHENPGARTIISAGGQNVFIIELEEGLVKPWKVYSNPLCAAGTGRFLEQQAYRLGISLEEFGAAALRFTGNAPRIAARCSVFAKSDLIHLQQKGVSVEAMLYSLCESIARMTTSLRKGPFAEPIIFSGGMAANPAVLKALAAAITSRNGRATEIVVPADYMYTESFGLAKLAMQGSSSVSFLPEADVCQTYCQLPGLDVSETGNMNFSATITRPCTAYLGVDIGSTSTKAVLLDQKGEVIAKDYLMTAGRPVEAVKQLFTNLLSLGAGQVEIGAAGVTGSGRYLIGSLIGADLVKNEITAQVRAAQELDANADIIEIGGQDSKLVLKKNGIVIDYQMNKACAAGTGSFLDELAEMLGVSVKNGEFAALASNAPHTIDLGTRCAAFMNQSISLAQQQNIPLEVIIASLARSIARNYLSKVVGSRHLGNSIILTGAVFYNNAVVAAFEQELAGRQVTVAPHREVSGAIGAALLAKESAAGSKSAFRGFRQVIDAECELSTFICKSCDNNCTITRMKLADGSQVYFGSRCDLYDASNRTQKLETAFDEREKLLLGNYTGRKASLVVGIPRALLVYDYAPMLISFVNNLGAETRLSGRTTKSIMEKSVELSYSDSCFPLKLLHGHIDSLAGSDYILYPCAIRLGEKGHEGNQKYTCPLVQASPFIAREVLGAGNRLLSPIIDFSRGSSEAIANLGRAAVAMGFSYRKGKTAALAAIKAQNTFKEKTRLLGKHILEDLRRTGKLGVVIISRSYMSQDSGANLGIAEKLAQLGVVPVPLDCLALESVNPELYSDRPYWSYEGKFISAAAIVAQDPQLYGLVLTNFGCGPDSFIIKILEDICGSKPLGQLETDEHAAEAGMVTRLEAYVDTITGYARSAKPQPAVPASKVFRGTSASIGSNKTLLIPNMSFHAKVLSATMQHFGVDARVLPEPDETDLLYASDVTAGTECLPYRVTLGSFLRFFKENPGATGVQGFMSGSYGPCRLGKYAVEQERLLREAGYELPMCTTVSNNAYRDLNLGPGFERTAWKGIVAVDQLERLLWHCRPYARDKAAVNQLFESCLDAISGSILQGKSYDGLLEKATRDFSSLVDPGIEAKPLVGINGEIFLRANRFSNRHLVEACEDAGLEVVVSPMSEWLKYITHRNIEDGLQDRRVKKVLVGTLKKHIQNRDERNITRHFHQVLNGIEPDTGEILQISRRYLSPRCGSEAVLSLGSGIEWLKSAEFSGAISVMPHGCMPGGIVAAMADKLSDLHSKPWISLTYDGFLESNNLSRITNFAEIVKFCQTGRRAGS